MGTGKSNFLKKTIETWQGRKSYFDPESNQIKAKLNLDKFKLVDCRILVEWFNPIKQKEEPLLKIPVVDGAGIGGISADFALELSVGLPDYEMVVSSGQKFRPIQIVAAGLADTLLEFTPHAEYAGA